MVLDLASGGTPARSEYRMDTASYSRLRLGASRFSTIGMNGWCGWLSACHGPARPSFSYSGSCAARGPAGEAAMHGDRGYSVGRIAGFSPAVQPTNLAASR